MQFIKRHPELERPLFSYQAEVLETMHRAADEGRDYHGLFFQMRLGKTLQCIRYCKSRGHNKVLVIAPLSIIEPTWKAELLLEQMPFFQFTADYLRYLQSGRSAGESYHFQQIDDLWHLPRVWAITNYEYLMYRSRKSDNSAKPGIDLSLIDPTRSTNTKSNGSIASSRIPHNLECPPEPWDCVIIDESVRLANYKNKISEFCCNYFRDVKCRIILTGEATPNDLAQYFQPIKFLKGNFMEETEYQDFKYKHFAYTSNNKLIPYRQSLPKMQEELRHFCYKVRRQDVNVGSSKVYEQRIVDFKPEYRTLYNFMESTWALGETATQWVIVAQNYLHQMCGGYPGFDRALESHHKFDALTELLNGDLINEKVVIWCRFREEQARLVHRLQHFWPASVGINGGVPISERTRYIDRFQNTDKLNILVCTYGTLDFGIDLSAADTMVYWSNSWSRNARIQSEDRIIHPRKRYPLLYIDLVTKDSIDCDIIANHMDKANRTDSYNERIYAKFIERMRKRQAENGETAEIVIPERYSRRISQLQQESKTLQTSAGLV